MMCMTELHGGVCHRTSTPHKSGNKMKEKKKIIILTKMFKQIKQIRITLMTMFKVHQMKYANLYVTTRNTGQCCIVFCA